MDELNGSSSTGEIMIVDDDLISLRMLSEMLANEGYSVRGAKDGATALQYIDREAPELVLLDVIMPGMDGYEVCAKLKGNDKTQDIPVLFLSGADNAEGKVKGFQVGAVDFISKPFEVEEVLARVSAHLALSRLRQHLEERVAERTEELEVSEKQLRLLADSMPALVAYVNAQEQFEFMNATFEKWCAEESPAVVSGKTFGGDMRSVYGDAYDEKLKPFVGRVLAGEAVRFDFESIDKTGQTHYCHNVYTPKLAADGSTLGFYVLALEITDRKQAEKKLQEAFAEIKKLKEQLEAENVILREEVQSTHAKDHFTGESAATQAAYTSAQQVAPTNATVLITGETGTGKELMARWIHEQSPRNGKPMIAVNCAALPETLLESELFGHEKGAYTGAQKRQEGRFEAADGGTILLDEIGEMPLLAQAKLLRVLQEGEFERLGSSQPVKVDVRVLASTNRDLLEEVEAGRFREDLYYRLNVFPVSMPPLRERQDDLEPLVWFLVERLANSMGKTIDSIEKSSMEAIKQYPWPGNIRELQNIIERAIILATGPVLSIEVPGVSKKAAASKADASPLGLEAVQRQHIERVLDKTDWRVRGEGGAAEMLEMNPSTLESRMKKLGISRS